MNVLLDHNTPVQLARHLEGHDVKTTRAMRWTLLSNGNLLKAAELDGFEAMITGDHGIVYQQNNLLRRIALIVLGNTDRIVLLNHVPMVLDALARCQPGSYEFIELPRSRVIRSGRR